MSASHSIESRLIEFMSQRAADTETISANTPIVQAGLLDSLTLMDLMAFIESSWEVRIGFEDMNAHNFRDIQTLTSLIHERMTTLSQQAQN